MLGQQNRHPLYSLKSTRELFAGFRDARPPTDKAWLHRVYCTTVLCSQNFRPHKTLMKFTNFRRDETRAQFLAKSFQPWLFRATTAQVLDLSRDVSRKSTWIGQTPLFASLRMNERVREYNKFRINCKSWRRDGRIGSGYIANDARCKILTLCNFRRVLENTSSNSIQGLEYPGYLVREI